MEHNKDNPENTGGEKGEKAPSALAQRGELGTPKEDPTLTEAQAEEMVQAARIKGGWDAKALEKRETALKAGEQSLKTWQDTKDAAEREAVKDDPEKLDVVVERQKLATREATLKTSEATHAADIKAANDGKLEMACFKIAGEHEGLKAEDLKEAAVRYKLTSVEDIEDLAKRMGKGEPVDDKGKKLPVKRPDSGRTMGGGEDWRDLTPDQKLREGSK